jgi:predicted DNA repair protein MutK
MVGGGILAHGYYPLGENIQSLTAMFGGVAVVGPALTLLAPLLGSIVTGMIAGAAVLAVVMLWQRLRSD